MARNPIDPNTGKPKRGRPRNADRDNDGSSGGIDGISGNPSDTGSGNGIETGNHRSGTAGDREESTAGNAFPAASVTVETQTAQPKRTQRKSSSAAPKGAIKPEHVETWIVQGFSLVAMFRNADYWAIHNPKVEVQPWAAPAAELLNKMSGEHAQKIAEGNAVLSVCLGMFALVSARMRMDVMVRRQRLAEERENEIALDNLSYINPDVQAEPERVYSSRPMPGTGAFSVAPKETLFSSDSTAPLNLRDSS